MILDQALSLLLVSLAVAVLPGLSRLVRLPAPVIEIIFGIILGKSLLHLQFGGEWLAFLAHLGFLLLMFYSGMDIDFGMLMKQSWKQLLFQLFVFCATLALSGLFSLYLGRGIFLALVLSTTSLGLVMPTLRETGLSRTAFGQNMLIAASIADFLTLLGITFYVLGSQYGLTLRFVSPLFLFVGFGILLWAGRLWAWWNPDKAERLLDSGDSLELGVRLSLALLFLLVALSELVHLEPVLGAFLGGCVLSFVLREKEELESKISALGFGFLIPIFFIHVGMHFDLTSLFAADTIVLTLKLVVLAFIVKILPGLLFVFQGMSFKDSYQTGVLLSARLSLIVAAATIGLQQGFIDQEMKDVIVLLALFTCLIAPTAFKSLSKAPEGTRDQ